MDGSETPAFEALVVWNCGFEATMNLLHSFYDAVNSIVYVNDAYRRYM